MELDYALQEVGSLSEAGYDGIVLVSEAGKETGIPTELLSVIKKAEQIDSDLHDSGAVLGVELPAKRLVYAPTGKITADYHDVRQFGDAAKKGILRALKSGSKSPLIVLVDNKRFERTRLVTLLGALEGLYMNLQWREDRPEKSPKVKALGVWSDDPKGLPALLQLAGALETGRVLARDIGGPDPERMSPINVEKAVRGAFPSNSGITLEVISDENVLNKEYPLYAAVNRAASVIDRHKGRIIYLTYQGSAPTQTLLVVGKGVTYDTGGADIKAGGIMAGMCRDKCGAAAVAGFMKILSILKPKHLKVIGAMSMVRNSVGENCYVSDEMIMCRAGKRVRVGNTDAEGRMIMADVLCRMKELAVGEKNPQIFTIATLTGHALRTVGEGYTIAMDNGPARKAQTAAKLATAGELIGDIVDISRVRREDYETHRGKAEGEDVVQATNLPSAQAKRGHQAPSAFLILASGLEEHGLEGAKPLPYTHLDIAASCGEVPKDATGAPVLALSTAYLNL
uniref:Putative aminopeptidase W07G4.4 n=1 Tax=Lygus hesperus TaxID=30085 RepID=A0A146M6X8_LYGHE